MWFEKLTGFREESPEQVRNNISLERDKLYSHVNGKKYLFGQLETPTLGELRQRIKGITPSSKIVSLREVVGDVQVLHSQSRNANSLFQVASQFNLLEMVSPKISPEQGVSRYEGDPTQGPACAIAAGAGTIYRNYFAEVNGQIGQTADSQIDCLAEIGKALGNTNNRFWKMENGYAMVSEKGLKEIMKTLNSASEPEIDNLRQLLRIGIQWNTEVTINDANHTVSQAYCSALPIKYSHHTEDQWSEFAQLILEASYEATICAAILNFHRTGNNKLFLTLVGGGVFGNKVTWILKAIHRSLQKYKQYGLDVVIVSFSGSNIYVQDLIRNYKEL